MSTDQKLLTSAASKAGIDMPKGFSPSDQLPAASLKEISNAQISADYDAKITKLIKDYLIVYQSRLKSAYDKTSSNSVKSALDSAYNNSDEFLKDL